jgi:uncharacterized protein (TIGR02246 family)
MAAKEPADVDRLFAEYLNTGNIDGVVGLYEPDAVLLVPGGDMATGHDAIRAAITQLVSSGLQLQMNVTKVLRCGDTAVLYNDWTGSTTTPEGKTEPMSGKSVEVVRRQPDGTWLMAIDDPNGRG